MFSYSPHTVYTLTGCFSSSPWNGESTRLTTTTTKKHIFLSLLWPIHIKLTSKEKYCTLRNKQWDVQHVLFSLINWGHLIIFAVSQMVWSQTTSTGYTQGHSHFPLRSILILKCDVLVVTSYLPQSLNDFRSYNSETTLANTLHCRPVVTFG